MSDTTAAAVAGAATHAHTLPDDGLAGTLVGRAWVAGSPLRFTSPNAPPKRDVLGTALLGVLASLATSKLRLVSAGVAGAAAVAAAGPDATALRQKFLEAMDDDFNTPEAMAVLFDLVKDQQFIEDIQRFKFTFFP